MTYFFEHLVVEKIKSLLPEGYFINSNSYNNNVFFIPDAIIYKDREPVAIIEIKSDISNRRDRINGILMLQSYSESSGIKLKILTDGKRVLSFSDQSELDNSSKIKLLSIDEYFRHFNEKIIINEGEIEYAIAVDFLSYVNEYIRASNLKEDFKRYVRQLSVNVIRKSIILSPNGKLYFNDVFENDMFFKLLGEYHEKQLCRYTTISTLKRILSDKKACVCSITGMNDKSECYYVDQYLQNSNAQILLSNMSIATVEDLNDYMIMSCSDISMMDKLTMWRMYAEEAKGVCIRYSIDDITQYFGFYLAPVSYANAGGKHPELDFVNFMLNLKVKDYGFVFRNLNLWKHFFKPYDYADEQEVRLLYQCPKNQRASKYKWINTGDGVFCPVAEFNIAEKGKSGEKINNDFPLIIDSITLGPNMQEKFTNEPQLDIYANTCGLYHVGKKIEIKVSRIENYR